MAWHDFHFLRPYWFLAISIIPLLFWLLVNCHRYTNHWQEVCDPHLFEELNSHNNHYRRHWPIYLICLLWLMTIVALAGPTWARQPQPLYAAQTAKILAVDLSSAMLATDLSPNRMERANFKILDILNNFPDSFTGMVAFSSEAFVVSPITQDNKTIAAMVPLLNPSLMPVSGSNLSVAMKKAAELLQQANTPHGSIILITANNPTIADLTTARDLHAQGYTISVLGIGTKSGSPVPLPNGGFLTGSNGNALISKLDPNELTELARIGGGTFALFTNDNSDINTIFRHKHRLFLAPGKYEADTVLWQDQGRWLILLILPLALLAFLPSFMERIVP